jgi:ribosome-associated protein
VRIRHSSFDARQHRDQPEEPQEPSARYDRPSKSQLKREMTALQLLKLPLSKLRDMPIPEKLFDAIELAQRIRDREGLRRQRQYIGRLMRDVDPAPLRDALSVDGAAHRAEVAAMHSAERWRERLLADNAALAEFCSGYPQGPRELEKLEKLVAGARAEASSPQHGRSYRQLYRLLRDIVLAASMPQPAARPAGDADDDAEPDTADEARARSGSDRRPDADDAENA